MLHSAVFWGGHMGEIGPGWYHHWSYDEVGRCAEMRRLRRPCAPMNWQREAGDMEGVAVWKRIVKAIEESLSEERPDDAEVH